MRDFIGRPYWILVSSTLLTAAAVLGCPPSGDDDGQITVPNVVGMTRANAQLNLALVGLTVGAVTEQHNATVPAGSVISQSPSAGTSVEQGRAVNLVISRGPGSGAPDLAVNPASVSLSPSSPSATVTVSNAGGGTLSWTAVSNDAAVTVTPSFFTGNSRVMTIATSDFSESYSAQVTFTNDDDAADTGVVTVSVAGSGGPGDEETIMLPGDVPLEMVWIAGGTFMMGRYPGEQDSLDAEDSQHQVTLSQGFWMGKYELTKAQWTAVMGTEPWSGQGYVLDDPASPAVYVSWDDAQAFMTALNSYTGRTFRLPTEAEWEYACRAGTTTRFYWGDDPSYTVGDDYCWWSYNAWAVGEEYAHVVGQKLPNAFGLYDMSGNVWEWCQDWYGAYPSGSVTDPTGPSSGSYRVFRGGSWGHSGRDCRSATRTYRDPSCTLHHLGFRLSR